MSIGAPPAPEELFVIPHGDEFYLYAPLRRCLAVVNGAAAAAVTEYLQHGRAALAPEAERVVRDLEARGLIGGEEPRPPTFPQDYTFMPHEVTLFLTSRCNLRCRYCYADAGRKAVDMPWEVARAAIDLVAANSGRLGLPAFQVGFHGGGEPTMAWELLVRAVEHARGRAEALGLRAEIFAATNGLLTPAQRSFVTANFTSANVSLDGPPDVQDHNRTRAGGGGSYDEVSETLKAFAAAGLHHGVRATITAPFVDRMVEVVEHMHAEFSLAYLHMEPVWQCGRCIRTGETAPPDDAFVAGFLRARERGRELGLAVVYSGARLDVLTSKFCAAPGDGFSVLPEGIATSCYEVTEADDPRAAVFHYGAFDPANRTFAFDHSRLAALRGLSVEHLPFCRDCFCRWHCAGDCLAKAFERSGSAVHDGSTRCQLNRTLTLADLERLVRAEQGADLVAPANGAHTHA